MIQIAFYGKGGIGKSTTVTNIAAYWALRGLTVLQVGCDPKADSTLALRHGIRIPTVMEKVRSREPFALEDVTAVWRPSGANSENISGKNFPGKTGCVICAEAGGPLPGLGCAGRGIITALEKLREKGIYERYQPDAVFYDVLGDVVCGGFAMPMREGYAEKVFVLTSGENMSIYAAANIGLAVENFRERGYAELGGLILNRRNVRDEKKKVTELAGELHTEVIGVLTRSPVVTDAEELGKCVLEAFPESSMAGEYRALADAVAAKSGVVYPHP